MILTLFLAAATLAAAAIRICTKCSWEIPEGADACTHCGQKVEAPAAATPAGAPDGSSAIPLPDLAPGAAPGASLTATAEAGATNLLKLAAWARQNSRPWLCWLSAGRARVLAALAGPASPTLQTQSEALRRDAAQRILFRRITCPACEGTGRGVMQSLTFARERRVTLTPSEPCPGCGGAREFAARKTLDEINREYAAANDQFREYGNRLGLLQVRNLWLPAIMSTGLDVRASAAVRSAAMAECPDCFGLGRTGCPECNGVGMEKCTANDCERGMTLCPDCKGDKRTQVDSNARMENTAGRNLRESCRTCNQTGLVGCPECKGRGLIACESCKSTGTLVCRRCKGLGQLDACTRCDGKGYQDCPKCRGAGTYNGAPCPTCAGQQAALCDSCGGTGRAGGKR
jgi:hypothetical protein